MDTFETLYVDPYDTLGSSNLAVVDDTLYYQVGATTLRTFAPGSGSTNIVVPADLAPFAAFWVDGDSFLIFAANGLVRLPIGGGAPEVLSTNADLAPLDAAHPASLVKDATTFYGAGSPPLPNGLPGTDILVARVPLAGGAARLLADVPMAGRRGLGIQLFDMGDVLWLQSDAGEIFSIGKMDGRVLKLAGARGLDVLQLFAPDGTSAMYGLHGRDGLASFAFDGTVTPLWPSTAPPFDAQALTLDGDGTAYVAGFTAAPIAVAAIRPGAAPRIVRCFADASASNMSLLTLGKSVIYAKVMVSGGNRVVRFSK